MDRRERYLDGQICTVVTMTPAEMTTVGSALIAGCNALQVDCTEVLPADGTTYSIGAPASIIDALIREGRQI